MRQRSIVLIRDWDEVTISRPAFIFTTSLLELSASQRILTEVQQCCISHERSYVIFSEQSMGSVNSTLTLFLAHMRCHGRLLVFIKLI